MAERPIFLPSPNRDELVKEVSVKLVWHPGFAESQKKRNIHSLHQEAARLGYSPLLEVSTKSDDKVGQHLSAFHLKVKSPVGDVPLECIFQGSKIFEGGGPFTDLFEVDPRAAKRDPRLRDSGSLVAFEFRGVRFPLEPKTAFYDWLYLGAIFPHRAWLSRLHNFAGFTDIEFNPGRSINCQARSMALFFSLQSHGILDEAMEGAAAFLRVLRDHGYETSNHASLAQEQLAY